MIDRCENVERGYSLFVVVDVFVDECVEVCLNLIVKVRLEVGRIEWLYRFCSEGFKLVVNIF